MSEKILNIQGSNVQITKEEYISITDIAKHKNKEHPDDIVKNWLRNKSTLEFLGLWEKINKEIFRLEFNKNFSKSKLQNTY